MKILNVQEMQLALREAGYEVEKSVISDYYRLIHVEDEQLIHDDPACEDVYDEETATAMYYGWLMEGAMPEAQL